MKEGEGGSRKGKVRANRGSCAPRAKRWDGNVEWWEERTTVEGFGIPFPHVTPERHHGRPVKGYAKEDPCEMPTVFETSEDGPTKRR